ncbi:26S proteasome non-ATPase regulatory subunit 5 [Polychytrium aggregatum]|uniref:26S proteasome non-ATPase regulatory subunit 5 n=1 Tax=Polychytrium aggregatum TaxID=110093 RepID=UPI0022FE01EC|nr:26S proteasome non-ATPase regulatory subunit 5 [Polychytrium aggregatum]KAI9199283.1 26S proteasome non-ATPase regulatory subunit 5 [Polychytrium aggregatum]
MTLSPSATMSLDEAAAVVLASSPEPDVLANAIRTIASALDGTSGVERKRQLTAQLGLSSGPIVDLLGQSGSPGFHDDICKILAHFLDVMSTDQIVSQFEALFLTGIQHPQASVRILVLQALEVLFDRTAAGAQEPYLPSVDLMTLILYSLEFSELRVASKIAGYLVKICAHPQGSERLFGCIAEPFEQLLTCSETIKFRVYDLAAQLSAVSSEAYERINQSGVLLQLIEELGSDDVLSQMAVLELFTAMAGHSLVFLRRSGALARLALAVQDGNFDDIDAVLLKSAILKFFSAIAAEQENLIESFESEYRLLDSIEKYLDCDRLELQESAVVFLGNAVSTEAGIRLLVARPSLLGNFAYTVKRSSGSLRIHCIKALSCILSATDDASTHAVYREVRALLDMVKTLQADLRSAFDETRIPAYALTKSIAAHRWGLEELSQHPDFLTFLLDRSMDTSHSGKEWRFAIAQTVVAHNAVQTLFDPAVLGQFRQYVKQGPFSMPLVPHVAFESA